MKAMMEAVQLTACGDEEEHSAVEERDGKGMFFYNFLTDVRDILYPTTTPVPSSTLVQEAETLTENLKSANDVEEKIEAVLSQATVSSRRRRAAATTCSEFNDQCSQCKFHVLCINQTFLLHFFSLFS